MSTHANDTVARNCVAAVGLGQDRVVQQLTYRSLLDCTSHYLRPCVVTFVVPTPSSKMYAWSFSFSASPIPSSDLVCTSYSQLGLDDSRAEFGILLALPAKSSGFLPLSFHTAPHTNAV